jgi:RNA polymerase sigma factor (sigma-70 family)
MRLSKVFSRTSRSARDRGGQRGGALPPDRHGARFQTTRRSLVLRAGADGGERALSELFRAYTDPIRAFLLSKGARHDEVEDISQGLFESLHRRRDIRKFDPSLGRFRSWLRSCAKNYLLNFRAHEHREAAGHGHVFVSLDDVVTDPKALRVDEGISPERLLARRRALTVVDRSLTRLRGFHAAQGDQALFQSLEAKLSGEGSDVSDAELAELIGKPSGGVRGDRCKMKEDMKRRYGRYIREEMAKTGSAPGSIDDAIRELLEALA